jgi:hypothetical protein
MHRTHRFALLAVLASPAGAQQFLETFSYPNGPAIPGWTARNTGSWSILNGRLTKSGGGSPDFLTKDGITAKNCVLDVEVFYGTTNGVQHGGLTARHNGSSTTTPSLYCKIQDNGGAFDLDRVFLYEAGGFGSATIAVTPPVQTAVVRMIVLDSEVTVSIDTDKNGVFDLVLGPRTLTAMLAPGGVGCSITSNCQLDNFEYFDGVLAERTPPRIGTTWRVRFATPVAANTPWFAALALGNGGIPIGSRAVPLALDPLFALTLANAGAIGLAGVVDAAGDGNLAFPVPNDPSLAGVALFAAAMTLDASRPFGVGTISQDLRAVLQP